VFRFAVVAFIIAIVQGVAPAWTQTATCSALRAVANDLAGQPKALIGARESEYEWRARQAVPDASECLVAKGVDGPVDEVFYCNFLEDDPSIAGVRLRTMEKELAGCFPDFEQLRVGAAMDCSGRWPGRDSQLFIHLAPDRYEGLGVHQGSSSRLHLALTCQQRD